MVIRNYFESGHTFRSTKVAWRKSRQVWTWLTMLRNTQPKKFVSDVTYTCSVSRYGVCTRRKNCKIFRFRLLAVKRNGKVLWKLKKTLFWAHSGHFLPILEHKNFWKTYFCHISLFLDFYYYAKIFYRISKLYNNSFDEWKLISLYLIEISFHSSFKLN